MSYDISIQNLQYKWINAITSRRTKKTLLLLKLITMSINDNL